MSKNLSNGLYCIQFSYVILCINTIAKLNTNRVSHYTYNLLYFIRIISYTTSNKVIGLYDVIAYKSYGIALIILLQQNDYFFTAFIWTVILITKARRHIINEPKAIIKVNASYVVIIPPPSFNLTIGGIINII